VAAGLEPVKLNCVVMPGVNEDAVLALARLSLQRPLHVRFIEFMPVGDRSRHLALGVRSSDELLAILREEGPLEPLATGPAGQGPAEYWRWSGGLGTVGFIHPMSDHFCDTCNRIRLTAQGAVKACLLKASEVDLAGPLRRGIPAGDLKALVLASLALKPEWHELGDALQDLTMSQIGG
jgi:cyclic pyranopterin phosphate synthase